MSKRHEALPPPGNQHLFFDVRPNLDDPIQEHTFDELLSFAKSIEDRLEIHTSDRAIAVSRGNIGADSVHIDTKNENGIQSLWVSINSLVQLKDAPQSLGLLIGPSTDTLKSVDIDVREDAGTISDPWQIGAGSVTTELSTRGSRVIDREFSLSNQRIIELTELLRARDDSHPFTVEDIPRL